MAVSKRLRYEVFRRDNHACRYCGAAAPDATLTIDHVVPVALGGTDDPGNLVTACKDCNAGKSASSPDAPIVADVSSDALRWGRAMAAASEAMLHDHRERADRRERFLEYWTDGAPQWCELEDGWERSIDSLIAAGLPLAVIFECCDIAFAASHVARRNRFRYMCGTAWKKVGELREIAAQMVTAEEQAVAGERPRGRHRAPDSAVPSVPVSFAEAMKQLWG